MKTIKVAGVSFNGRQDMIKKLHMESVVEFKPEPANRHDPYAVKIIADGMHIGYVPKELAKHISETWDLYRYVAKIDSIIEGDDNKNRKLHWGVRIAFGRGRRKNANL